MNERSRMDAYNEVVDTDVARERIAELRQIAAAFYPEPIEDVFVSEYREEEGRQVIESVWMFSESYAMEFKNPLQEDNFDLSILKNSLAWLEASRKDFDFSEWTDSSRLTVRFKLWFGIYGSLRATRRNCLELLRIAKDRLMTNAAAMVSTSDTWRFRVRGVDFQEE